MIHEINFLHGSENRLDPVVHCLAYYSHPVASVVDVLLDMSTVAAASTVS